jgi:hypothetical protein
MEKSGFLNRFTIKAILVGIFGFSLGCGSTHSEQEPFTSTPSDPGLFMGEGFQSSLPNAGTQVVVWGNHSGAVSRTLGWMKEHHIGVVDPSWIEKQLKDPDFALRTESEQKAQVLGAAQSVRAPFVIFAQVEASQQGRKFDRMTFQEQRLKIIGVEIRGMKTESGDVVFGAKAWNSKPLVESEQIVQDLTTFALHKAWNEPDPPLQPQQESVEQKPQQEHMSVENSIAGTAPLAPVEPQSELVEQKPQHEQMTVETSFADTAPHVPEEPQSEMVDSLSLEEEPSLGLQVASGALSILYMPFKVVYAGFGGLMGGLVYLVTAGNEHTAQSVWDASLRGTYWLTPNHLQGKEAILFKGEAPIN